MFKFTMRYFIVLFFSLLLTPTIQAESLKDIHKTTKQSKTVEAASQAMAEHSNVLRQLMLRLYQANPNELKKSTQVSAEEMVQWTFEGPFGWKFDGVRHLQELDALSLAVDADFPGDRVLALITGLHTSLTRAYGGKNEYDFSGEIDPQYLYNTARNIEIARIKITELNQTQLDKFKQTLSLLDGEKPVDLTQQLNELIRRVDADANRFAGQKQQTIQLLDRRSADSISWQVQ
ncbi:hypothetical protein [Methylotenera versatilis]|uniref:hypothetical protein n=1 Tax=Methylotenera versatilis TaxID=1055487 RepID=UPI000645D424|nr:hypothetical protein [Methylotenera versatilis]